MTLVQIIATILVFGAVGVLGLILAARIKLPYSLILVALGFALSFAIEPLGWDTGIRASNFDDLMLLGLLPLLIFEAAFGLELQLLKRYLPNTLTLATLGLVISSLVTALVLFYGINHTGFPFIAALLTGVIVSATDPVAVVSQLKELNAPADLNVLIEGESLFNDATAIVLFGIVSSIALGAAELNISDAILRFGVVFIGGMVVGAMMGCLAALLTHWVEAQAAHIIFISVLLAYGSFYVGEYLLHVSGIVSVMSAALVFKALAQRVLKTCHKSIEHTWRFLGFSANVFVFVLLGVVITVSMFSERWLAMLLAAGGCLLARLIAIYASNALNKFTIGQTVNAKYAPIMVWGGLRGAVTIALVLSLPTELPYWWTIQSIGFGVVLFTLVVQAPTTPWLMKRMRITG